MESSAGCVPPVGELRDLETVGASFEHELAATPKVRNSTTCKATRKSPALDRMIVFKWVTLYVKVVVVVAKIQTTKRHYYRQDTL